MSSQYGVNTVVSANASRPISIESTTPIYVVGAVVPTAEIKDQLERNNFIMHFGNTEKALSFFGESTGTIRAVLDGISDHVSTPVIVGCVTITEAESKKKAESFYDNPKIKSAVIETVKKAKTAMAVYGIKSNLIIAPRFSHDLAVRAEMQVVATDLTATGIVDLNATSEADALKKVKEISTRRLLVTDPYVKVWNTALDKEVTEPMSSRVAGLIAMSDGMKEYGWSQSASNRVMQGIVGVARPIEFIAGKNCEADRYRSNGIATVINYQGLRLWGFETTDIDSIWKNLDRVRVFDRVSEAVLEGVFYAIDRGADILIHAKNSVDGLLLSLKGAMVLIGYEVFWHPTKNTAEALTANKFYLVAEMQDTGSVRRLEVECSFVDRYSPVLMKIIGA